MEPKIAAPRGSGGGSISRAIFALRLRDARLLADSSRHALPGGAGSPCRSGARRGPSSAGRPSRGRAQRGVERQQQPVPVAGALEPDEGRKKQVVAGGSARGRALEPDEGMEEEEVWIRREDLEGKRKIE